MDIQQITDRKTLAEYFSQDKSLHLYSLGDLDDFYWPHCTYFASFLDGDLQNVSLLYQGEGLPILLALGEIKGEFLRQLWKLLPSKFYAHLSPGLEEVFRSDYRIMDYGSHYKMSLEDFDHLRTLDPGNTFPLSDQNLPAIQDLYRHSYPDNAFDARMLESGQYFGLSHQGKLTSIAGIHVFSPDYQVAALGNITTHPDFRGLGFGQSVTTRLCQELADQVTLIGLNVKVDNQAAISLYRGLGFRISSEYGEFSLQKRA